MECGYCKDCSFRINRRCMNGDKIDEDYSQGSGEDDDRLIYDYQGLFHKKS